MVGPAFIVVSLTLFELPAWIAEESAEGARYEASVHNDLGRSAMKNKRYSEAAAQFKTALMIDPEYTDAYMNLGIVLHLLGDARQAIACMKKVTELDTTSWESVYNNIGMIYGDQGEYEKALEMFRKALQVNRRSVIIYRNIAEIALVHKDWETAVEALDKAIENRPTMGNMYEAMIQEAMQKYVDEENYADIVDALSEPITDEVLGKFDARIANELTWQDPKLAADFTNLARALTELGRFDEAAYAYQNALKITPSDHVLLNRLGIVYARSGDLEKAAQQFEQALRIKPGFTDARHNLERCRRRLGEE